MAAMLLWEVVGMVGVAVVVVVAMVEGDNNNGEVVKN
jgi:hypothetical protein